MRDIEKDICAFIQESFLYREQREPLAENESLLEAGLIDSTGVLELVGFLEQHFGIRIADAEMVPANLDSLRGLATFVRGKLGATEQAA
jgi:acyl carrier protein